MDEEEVERRRRLQPKATNSGQATDTALDRTRRPIGTEVNVQPKGQSLKESEMHSPDQLSEHQQLALFRSLLREAYLHVSRFHSSHMDHRICIVCGKDYLRPHEDFCFIGQAEDFLNRVKRNADDLNIDL